MDELAPEPGARSTWDADVSDTDPGVERGFRGPGTLTVREPTRVSVREGGWTGDRARSSASSAVRHPRWRLGEPGAHSRLAAAASVTFPRESFVS